MSVGERAQQARRWIATREPRSYLWVGWLVFMLGAYPGYLNVDATLQLYTVRSGEYSDYAPVMTALWGALEYVSAGPFPMLVVQSGLALFGMYAILARVLSRRAAAVTASTLLLFPPVFSLLAVIWPEPLMTAALIAAYGAAVTGGRRWQIAGALLAVVACACRPECVLAVIPLAAIALPAQAAWWRRAGLALAIAGGVFGAAMLANHALTVTETYTWEQRLLVPDTVGTLRRAKVKDAAALEAALAGLPLADRGALVERMGAYTDALDWYAVSNGPKAVLERLDSDAEEAALLSAWRRAIASHPAAYALHRWAVIRNLLGVSGKFVPVYDSFGPVDLLAPLHHRATASDWQYGMQLFVRAVGKTPLMRPYLYLALALVGLWLARRQRMLRALFASGLVLELTMFVFAPAGDYRYSHGLVTMTCIALAGLVVARRWPTTESAA